MVSLIFLFINNPLLGSYFLVFLSLYIAFFRANLTSLWFFVILILVFTGGIIILVIYISRLSSHHKHSFSSKKLIILFVISACLSLIARINEHQSFFFFCFLNHFFSLENYLLIGFVLMYLLIGLFLVVALVNKERGALRTYT